MPPPLQLSLLRNRSSVVSSPLAACLHFASPRSVALYPPRLALAPFFGSRAALPSVAAFSRVSIPPYRDPLLCFAVAFAGDLSSHTIAFDASVSIRNAWSVLAGSARAHASTQKYEYCAQKRASLQLLQSSDSDFAFAVEARREADKTG